MSTQYARAKPLEYYEGFGGRRIVVEELDVKLAEHGNDCAFKINGGKMEGRAVYGFNIKCRTEVPIFVEVWSYLADKDDKFIYHLGQLSQKVDRIVPRRLIVNGRLLYEIPNPTPPTL